MPQASPMNWMLFSTSIIFIMMSKMSTENNNMTNKKINKTNLKSKNISWKW